MTEWKRTFCPLCYHNCGLEAQTAGHRITKVRADKDHPRTRGYICRKGTKVGRYQDHGERLKFPLKREGSRFVEIAWDQALSEIAERLSETLRRHGPRSFAYMGGGGQGCHMEAGFGRNLMTALGSQYHYSALAQELTGLYWVNGRAYGRQNLQLGPDLDRAENFLVMGWNGYVSNAGVNRARFRIEEFAEDPDRSLIVIDPLRSETAVQANKHLKIKMGSAALFLKALIALILQEGWEDRTYLERHCLGFDHVLPWFEHFEVPAALSVCGLEVEAVREVARLYATRPTALKTDLGLLMDRQSTMNSYLEMILMAVCGRIGTPGGNVFEGHVMPLGLHTDERSPHTWRTVQSGVPAIMGYFPPNVLPEEILSSREDRLRAIIVSGANPLRSYADTSAYEQAFTQLDLLITFEVAMSETAALSHYVLPARSAFEKWDATLFNLTFPEIYFQLRHPCCEPQGDPKEEGEIFTLLADALGLLPQLPDALYTAAAGPRQGFAMELLSLMGQNKDISGVLPLVLGKTLGRAWSSAHMAGVWGLLLRYPQHAAGDLQRAGYQPSPLLGDALFQNLLDHPEGILIGRQDPDRNLEKVRTSDGKIHLYVEELAGWIQEIEPERERAALHNDEFPFVLAAGRHFPYTANSIMRDPAWNDGEQRCTLLMNKQDSERLGIPDGADAWVSTEAGRVRIPVQISEIPAPGSVVIPHGFGLVFQGQEHGVNVNRLTKNTHRDRLAATPLHRYVPCRVEPV